MTLSACVGYKPGSFAGSQPHGIGDVRLHLELCTEESPSPESGSEPCNPNEMEGEAQQILAFIVPSGSRPPANVTATPGPGATAITYTRNQEVADALVEEVGSEAEGVPFPAPGQELVGYLSAVYSEKEGDDLEWSIDADFGLPAAADGGSYAGPFSAAVATGWRRVDAEHPANRPVACDEEGASPGEIFSHCELSAGAEIDVSDLRVGTPAGNGANAGASASIPFPIDFASSVPSPPSFSLSAGTTLPGAAVSLSEATYVPGPPRGALHRSPAASRTVTVAIPAGATAGTYDVTLTARAPSGGTITRVAKLVVSKPAIAAIGFGKVRLNKRKGTATLPVRVPGAGTLTAFGKRIAKVKRSPKAARTVKVRIRAKGKAKKALRKKGKAKVRAKVRFKPLSGSAVQKSRSITLKKRHKRHIKRHKR